MFSKSGRVQLFAQHPLRMFDKHRKSKMSKSLSAKVLIHRPNFNISMKEKCVTMKKLSCSKHNSQTNYLNMFKVPICFIGQ
jgi:hypothetical protein